VRSEPVTRGRFEVDQSSAASKASSNPPDLGARFEARELDEERYGEDDQGRTVYDRYDARAFEAVVYDTYRRLTRSTFKRVQAPPVVAVSRRAFGTDFREPIINRWDGRPIQWS